MLYKSQGGNYFMKYILEYYITNDCLKIIKIAKFVKNNKKQFISKFKF